MQATVIGPDLVARPITLTQTAPGDMGPRLRRRTKARTWCRWRPGVRGTGAPGAGAGETGGRRWSRPRPALSCRTHPSTSMRAAAPARRSCATWRRRPGAANWPARRGLDATGRPAQAAQPLATPLLLLAALLLPLDVAVRRLRLSRRDWAGLRAWLAAVVDVYRPPQTGRVPPAAGQEPELWATYSPPASVAGAATRRRPEDNRRVGSWATGISNQ